MWEAVAFIGTFEGNFLRRLGFVEFNRLSRQKESGKAVYFLN